MNVETTIAAIDSQIAYLRTLGGKGSGNWGHSGRPGKVGGSGPSSGVKIMPPLKGKLGKPQKVEPVATGDCYEVACRNFLFPKEAPPELKEALEDPTIRLVHAEITGQGPVAGLKFGHAWLETNHSRKVPGNALIGDYEVDDSMVYDFSNGRKTIMPKSVYYAIGGIADFPDPTGKTLFRYTREEARKKVLESGHWGHWDLSTKY